MLEVYNEITAPDCTGTSLKDYINATYQELIDALGEPTFNEESGDGKTQVEWIVTFEDTFGDKMCLQFMIGKHIVEITLKIN